VEVGAVAVAAVEDHHGAAEVAAVEAAVVGDHHGGPLEAHLATLHNHMAVLDHQVLAQDLHLVRHGEDHHHQEDLRHWEDQLLLLPVLGGPLDQELKVHWDLVADHPLDQGHPLQPLVEAVQQAGQVTQPRLLVLEAELILLSVEHLFQHQNQLQLILEVLVLNLHLPVLERGDLQAQVELAQI